jgi:NADH-quinone oxidoreductase subunit H
MSEALQIILIACLKVVVICFVFALVLGALLSWVERKMSSVIQDRIGPNRAAILGIRAYGLFHPIADGIKALVKEDFVPEKANKVLFALAPVIAFTAPLVVFAVIPFGPGAPFVIAELDSGMLFVLAIAGLGIYGATLGGWSSGNSFALLGSLRASAQMISYEVSMGLNLVGVFMVFGTLSLSALVLKQGEVLFGLLPKWGIFVQPVGFILFLTAAMAENKRAPFDLPEGESEIVGYNLEYSSMRFALFFLSEFIEVVVISAVTATVFLGGWQIPFVYPQGNGPAVVTTLQVLAFLAKVVFVMWLLMTVRWTLPRFRYDQVMGLGWKVLLPLSLANIVVTAIVLAFI